MGDPKRDPIGDGGPLLDGGIKSGATGGASCHLGGGMEGIWGGYGVMGGLWGPHWSPEGMEGSYGVVGGGYGVLIGVMGGVMG